MKRLTKKVDGAWTAICEYGNPPYPVVTQDVIDRLAAIEDILCDGEDEYDLERLAAVYNQRVSMRDEVSQRFSLTAKIPLDRLRELVEADREGRCVVSPANVGNTVYHITTCKNFPQVLDGTMYGPDGGLGTATGWYCPCELAENCPFPCDSDGGFDCDEHKNTLAIFEDVVAGVFIEDMQDVITFGYSGSADFDAFGKTVFLTRAEAEAAIAKIATDCD